MKKLALSTNNTVVMTKEAFTELTNELTPLKKSIRTYAIEEKSIIQESTFGDCIYVQTGNGVTLEMKYVEFIEYPNEDKEQMRFVGEDKELNIFYSINSEEVFGDLTNVEKDEFIKNLNTQWHDFIKNNDFQIHVEIEDEDTGYVEEEEVEMKTILERIVFKEAEFERTLDGLYGGSYEINEYKLKFSFNGKLETMGAAPDYNEKSHETGQDWYLEHTLDYEDSFEGQIQIEGLKEFTTEFNITRFEEKALHKVFTLFDLVNKCEEEYKNRKEKYLQEETKLFQKILPKSQEVVLEFVGNGILVKINDKTSGELVHFFTKFTEVIKL